MRAFVALDLPEALLDPVSRLQAGLTVGRLVPEENLHLTLAFLGDVEDTRAHDLAEALASQRLPKVTLELGGLDLFGGKRSSALVIGADGDGLERLHAKVMRTAREVDIDLPRERFRPHVTIARFTGALTPKDQGRLADFLKLNGRFSLDPVACETITLYRSHLRNDGAIHEPLADFPLTD